MQALGSAKLGYFGKVPSTGDFVSRNIDRDVREGFDQWLQAGLAQSRKDLGDDWLHSFLTAPVWRFVIGGLGGAATTFGIMIPSVDKIGRYFPFAILGDLPAGKLDGADLVELDKILDELEPLILTSLEEDFDLDHFGYQLGLVNRQLAKGRPQASATSISALLEPAGLPNMEQVLADMDWRDSSVWWTRGSDYRQAEFFGVTGLPAPTAFARMLRDPDVFADLDHLWRSVRDLALTQSDNGHIEFDRQADGLTFHAVCHPGAAGARNFAYASLDPERPSIVLSDGRFATVHQAMISRLICKFVPGALLPEAGTLDDEQLGRLAAFLSAKLRAQNVNILPALSFAAVFRDPQIEHRLYLAAAGEYFCLRVSAEGVVPMLPNSDGQAEGATIRKVLDGQCLILPADLEPGETLLLSSSRLALPSIRQELGDALSGSSQPETLAHTALELGLLKGGSGNLAVAAVRLDQ